MLRFLMIFEHFSAIQLGAGRGAVPRYQHIYFLDRSRRKMSDFEIIWRGLGDSGVQDQKVQLQAKGCVPGACWSVRVDRPARSGRSRFLGNRKSARKQGRRASRCAAFPFFLVTSIGHATTVRPRSKSPWNRKFEPLESVETYIKWEGLVATNV